MHPSAFARFAFTSHCHRTPVVTVSSAQAQYSYIYENSWPGWTLCPSRMHLSAFQISPQSTSSLRTNRRLASQISRRQRRVFWRIFQFELAPRSCSGWTLANRHGRPYLVWEDISRYAYRINLRFVEESSCNFVRKIAFGSWGESIGSIWYKHDNEPLTY